MCCIAPATQTALTMTVNAAERQRQRGKRCGPRPLPQPASKRTTSCRRLGLIQQCRHAHRHALDRREVGHHRHPAEESAPPSQARRGSDIAAPMRRRARHDDPGQDRTSATSAPAGGGSRPWSGAAITQTASTRSATSAPRGAPRRDRPRYRRGRDAGRSRGRRSRRERWWGRVRHVRVVPRPYTAPVAGRGQTHRRLGGRRLAARAATHCGRRV